MCDSNSRSRGECYGPKTGATHNHAAQLGLPDKDYAIKRVGCLHMYVVVWLRSMIMGWVCGQAQGAWSGPLFCTG